LQRSATDRKPTDADRHRIPYSLRNPSNEDWPRARRTRTQGPLRRRWGWACRRNRGLLSPRRRPNSTGLRRCTELQTHKQTTVRCPRALSSSHRPRPRHRRSPRWNHALAPYHRCRRSHHARCHWHSKHSPARSRRRLGATRSDRPRSTHRNRFRSLRRRTAQARTESPSRNQTSSLTGERHPSTFPSKSNLASKRTARV